MVKVFTDRQFKDLLRPVHTLYLNCCIAFCRWTSSCQMIRFSFFLRCISLSSNCIALHCIALRCIELHWIGRTSDNGDGQLTKRRASVSADAKSKCPRSAPLGQMHSRSHFHTISREEVFERKHSASIGAAKSNCLLFWVSGLSLLRHQTFASKVFTHGWPFNKFSSTNNFYKTVICEAQSTVPSTTILYDLNHVDVLDQTVCIGLPTRPQDSDFANLVVCLPRVVGTNMQLGANSSVCNARQLWPWQLTSISQRITTVRSPILPGYQHQTPLPPPAPNLITLFLWLGFTHCGFCCALSNYYCCNYWWNLIHDQQIHDKQIYICDQPLHCEKIKKPSLCSFTLISHASRYSSCTTRVSMIVRQRYILKGFVTGGPENRKTWTPVVWWCSSFVQTWADYYYLGHRSILVFTGAQHQILVFAPTSGLCDGFHNRPHGLSASIAAPPQRRSGRGEERNGLGIFSLSCFPMS